uniref:Ovule protein n=1 Tax=Heterorhabditis bacteriophora TaxID=37862 RepID=A0A1I7WB60_HETBA
MPQCVSFGLTLNLLKFWKKSGFVPDKIYCFIILLSSINRRFFEYVYFHHALIVYNVHFILCVGFAPKVLITRVSITICTFVYY